MRLILPTPTSPYIGWQNWHACIFHEDMAFRFLLGGSSLHSDGKLSLHRMASSLQAGNLPTLHGTPFVSADFQDFWAMFFVYKFFLQVFLQVLLQPFPYCGAVERALMNIVIQYFIYSLIHELNNS